jgi:hypothetical protein
MRIGRALVSFSGLFSPVLAHVREWTPEPAFTEAECQLQLAELLRNLAPDGQVEREYMHNGCRIDLYIKHRGLLGGSDDIFIEAKLNLTTENEFKRLLGQIQLMKPRSVSE